MEMEYISINEMRAQLNKYCEQEYKKIIDAGRNPLEFELAWAIPDTVSTENEVTIRQTCYIRERELYCDGCEQYYKFSAIGCLRKCKYCGTLSEL